MSCILALHNAVASALRFDTRQLLRCAASAAHSCSKRTYLCVAAACADTEPAAQEVAEHIRFKIARMTLIACAS